MKPKYYQKLRKLAKQLCGSSGKDAMSMVVKKCIDLVEEELKLNSE